ncbi:protein kinase regulator [Drepanopeziza brunnea f. sp. 'multigermtubi' MB_m1]|uniref:Protein kinase regulator n=1 Tax=Marssonina brunnea f. sp. multigermtubi (strain MB_m1) TaxID=1072389 RepID=K1X8I4_MARBU|nr:protein kinase regulator [Drepanopeziza brunnea f. sp. 'multigermtubi' MB_m1]EKD17003.1 protein kinase regulator [Drepanopeziza brunnea f. sp. 'multigermtubi' MB_m1]
MQVNRAQPSDGRRAVKLRCGPAVNNNLLYNARMSTHLLYFRSPARPPIFGHSCHLSLSLYPQLFDVAPVGSSTVRPRALQVLPPVCTLSHSESTSTVPTELHDEDPFEGKSGLSNGIFCSPKPLLSNQRTRNQFRPRNANKGTTSYQLRQYAEATLGGGSLRKIVKLPEGEDENEWLAVNMVDFYNHINLLYGSITEFCSPQSCPEMKATDEFEYLWQDSENFKRPTKMPAPTYIEHLMGWVQSNIDNEAVFPSRIGVPFPKSFPSMIRQVFKRMYRVYAHIYCHHYPVIRELGLEAHLNTSFKHYVLFIDEHNLASGKDFWGPLGDLVDSMLRSD